MELILKYFPELSEKQTEQFRQLDVLYHDWNAKINVISRKDIDNLYEHHVLHSLGIAEFTRFKSGTDYGFGDGRRISGNTPRHHVPRLPFPSGGQHR